MKLMELNRINTLLGVLFGVNVRDSSSLVNPDILQQMQDALNSIFLTLTPREARVLRMRFGLNNENSILTQKLAAEHFGISVYELRKVENRALRKLRHPSRSRLLATFITEAEYYQAQGDNKPIELVQVIETIKELTPALIAHLQRHEDDLNKLHWQVFEHLVAEVLTSRGFEDVHLLGRNPKTSADIFATYFISPVGLKHNYFIEVKRWKKKIGIDIINKVLGAMIGEREKFGWHAAMIVTLVGYKNLKKWSREQLEMKGIYLKDKDELLRWLKDYKQNEDGLWLPKHQALRSSKIICNAT